MPSKSDFEEMLEDVEYLDWDFTVGQDGDRLYLQVQFRSPDLVTGLMEAQFGRKWFLSEYMTKSELTQTALKAVLTAIEHEAREAFKYRGKPIYGPHYSPDALHALYTREHLDYRQ